MQQLDEINSCLPLSWTAHRAAENPKKALTILFVIVLSGIGAAFYMEALMWGLFAIIVLFIGLSGFFLPRKYLIDSTGIREKYLGQERITSWYYFRRTVVVGSDILLSPYNKRTVMERFRAWNVHTPDNNTANLIAKLVEIKTAENKSGRNL